MDIDKGDNHLEQELSNDTKITPMVIIDDNDNAVESWSPKIFFFTFKILEKK